jgi:hypothetical protein
MILPSLAAELAAMPEAERRIAERIAELPDVEPPEGWEERALERWRRQEAKPAGDSGL